MSYKPLFLFICLVLCFIVYFWIENAIALPTNLQFVLYGHFLLHGSAAFTSLQQINYFKFPFVLFVSLVNLVTFFYAPAIIDAYEFQLGRLNYDILSELLIGFAIFYTTYFLVIHSQSIKRVLFKKNKAPANIRKDAFVRLKKIFIILYVLQLFFSFPISGLNEFIELFTIGLYAIGFLLRINSKFEDSLFFVLISYQSIKVITSSLIYTMIYFAIFLVVIFKNYGLKSRRGYLVFGVLMSFYLIFSVLFSPVKASYRTYQFTTNSVFEKLVVMYELITSNDLTNYENTIEKKTKDGPVWRLSYPLSAISLVKEKTPSTIPYWNGESYLPIFTKLIPRFLWPDKPTENMGQVFGHRYGILAWDNLSTSMNTPIIAEAYMNFGNTGFYLIFFIMALVMAKVYSKQNIIQNQDPLSIDTIINTITIAIVTVYFTQWESNLTMMIGKFIILYVTTNLIRRFIIQA
jgi:hypothetical protein